MTSACMFKDTLRNDTQVFLKFKISIFEISSHLINFNFTPYFLTLSMLTTNAGTSKEIPLDEKWNTITRNTIHFSKVNTYYSAAFYQSLKLKMFRPISSESNDFDLFYVEQMSNNLSPPRPNTSNVLSSTKMSGNNTLDNITISPIASPGPELLKTNLLRINQRCRMDWDRSYQTFLQTWTIWTFPLIHSEYWQQWRYQSLQQKDMTKTTAPNHRNVINFDAPDELQHNWGMGDSTYDIIWWKILLRWWTHENYFLPSSPSPPPPPRKVEGKLSLGMSFPKRKGVSQHVSEACGLSLPEPKEIPSWSSTNWKLKTENIIYIFTLFSSIVHKWYLVVTYQPHAHICNSCKPYVVVAYRSIIFTPWKKHVSYKCNSGELIQIGTEQLRNKRILIYHPYCLLIILLGAVFKTILTN